MRSFSSYQNPALAVDIVIFGYHEGRLSVLLLNRAEAPYKNVWTLPGAFLGMEETFEQACSRVLATKLGLSTLFMEQLYTFDDPGRDPRGRVISVAYYALINPSKFETSAGSMANDVKWHEIDKMPSLGFDHSTLFRTALQRLRSKILYQPIGFELLNELFTMSELHQLYECIQGRSIDRRNFARKILDVGFISSTGTKREGVKNRQPELFQFNKNIANNNFHLNI